MIGFFIFMAILALVLVILPANILCKRLFGVNLWEFIKELFS